MSGMSEVWQNSDSACISNESYHQTVAIQRLGHGHDWSDQPVVLQGSPMGLSCHRLFHKVGGGSTHEVSSVKRCDQLCQRTHHPQIWNPSDHYVRWRIGLYIRGIQKVCR